MGCIRPDTSSRGFQFGANLLYVEAISASSDCLLAKSEFSNRRRKHLGEESFKAAPGSELIEIFDRWIATSELVTWPTVNRDDIKTDRRYSIVIPMDLVPKLGRRRKVLQNVLPGPAILPDQVSEEIFAAAE